MSMLNAFLKFFILNVLICFAAGANVSFISPTPINSSSQNASSIYLNVSSNSSLNHFIIPDFDNSLKLWISFENFSGGSPLDSSSYNYSIGTSGVTQADGLWGYAGNFTDISYLVFSRPVQDDFTVCAWIKTGKSGADTTHWRTAVIFEAECGYVNHDFGFGINSNGKLAIGNGELGVGDFTLNGDIPVNDSSWHLVCGTRARSGGLGLYVDAVADGNTTGSVASLTCNPTAAIGMGTDGGISFNGLMDEITVFNRVLSTNEIRSIYNASFTQYQNNFTRLALGTHNFTAYVVDSAGVVNSTENRLVTTEISPVTNISNCQELQSMQDDLTQSYKLITNIDCTMTNPLDGDYDAMGPWSDGNGFMPIGNASNVFSGSFDGQDYNITGLYIYRSSTDYVGLFGKVTQVNISNVHLIDANISGREYTGLLVGYNYANIINSSTEGNLSGLSSVGGLVGLNTYIGELNQSYSAAFVTGVYYVGGLVGINYGSISNSSSSGGLPLQLDALGYSGNLVGANFGTILRSYSTAAMSSLCSCIFLGGLVGYFESGIINESYAASSINVSNSDYIGGLVGYTLAPIFNSYSLSSVQGHNIVGGLVGRNNGAGVINNSYSVGLVSALMANSGGLIATADSQVYNSFWDIQTSNQSTSAKGIGKTTAQMKNISTFTAINRSGNFNQSWDFNGNLNNDTELNNVWQISSVANDGYPYLNWQGLVSFPQVSYLSPTLANGSNSTTSYFTVNSSIRGSIVGVSYLFGSVTYQLYNSSLVLMYNLNNNSLLGENNTLVVDLSGNANNALTSGNAVPTSSGKFNGAYYFDGTADYLVVNDTGANTSIDVENKFTVCAWVYPANDSSQMNLVEKGNWTGSWLMLLNTSASGYLKNAFASSALGTVDGSIPVYVNQWSYVCNAWNGSTAFVYTNGQLDAASALSGTLTSNNLSLTIGARNDGTYAFNGYIDEVKLWNITLAAGEIAAQYNSNLNKFNSTQWYLEINQTNLRNTQTFYVCATNVSGDSCSIRRYVAFPVDSDGDSVTDESDTLWYNESNVTSTGISNLTITIGGNSTNGTFSGAQPIAIYDGTWLITNFTYNFTESTLDLSKVVIAKTSDSILVNFSGQLQNNKTLYLEDNAFTQLCVKDAQISSIENMSSDCTAASEVNFTSCLGNSAGITVNGITCIDLGTIIQVQNLSHSAIRGAVSSTREGSGGIMYVVRSQNTNFTNSTLNQTHSLPGKVEVQLPLNDSIKLPVVAASQSSDNNLLLIALCLVVVVIAYVIKIKQK